jgi:tetratricopeptide (TPR) repeat protein
MKFHRVPLTLACALALASPPTVAATEKEAADYARRGQFAEAAEAYTTLVQKNPRSIPLRMELADALAKDRQWDRAVTEYEGVLKLQPKNAEALRGIGTVRRWQGHIGEARRAYEQALKLEPSNAEGQLGLAATSALDHDFAAAQSQYDQAETKWPKDRGAQQAAYDFRRLRNPRLYLFWENDLSFETRQLGAIAPFAGREEIGAEVQEELRFAPDLSRIKTYTRTDKKILYTHFFGLNHMLDFSARASEYEYHAPTSALEYASIDTYEEYRARYTVPFAPEQVFAVRYTLRPTTLKLSQDSFTAHKLEAELSSRWVPRVSTLLGTGWLRDLDSNATNTSQLTNNTLVKLGAQWDPTNQLSIGAKYITNPDLDNTINATTIAEGSYSLTDTWSVLGRYRADDYKRGSDQTSLYAGARYVPNRHWWSEFGLKHAERGDASGNYGLVSIVLNF